MKLFPCMNLCWGDKPFAAGICTYAPKYPWQHGRKEKLSRALKRETTTHATYFRGEYLLPVAENDT